MLAIFLDLEATGLDPTRHRVIELAFKVMDLHKGEVVGSYQTVIKQPYEVWEKRDSFSIEVNGFHWGQVQEGEEEADVGHTVVSLFTDLGIQRGKSVFICQNPAFDRSFFAQIVDLYTQERLKWPYHWLDLASMYWALSMTRAYQEKRGIPEEINLSKDEIARRFNLPKENRPHRAMNGVDHLILCYKALFSAVPVAAFQ